MTEEVERDDYDGLGDGQVLQYKRFKRKRRTPLWGDSGSTVSQGGAGGFNLSKAGNLMIAAIGV